MKILMLDLDLDPEPHPGLRIIKKKTLNLCMTMNKLSPGSRSAYISKPWYEGYEEEIVTIFKN